MNPRPRGEPVHPASAGHPLDPNTLDFSVPQLRMYAGEFADFECLVDEEDYLFFTRWCWGIKISPGSGHKIYFRRNVSVYDLTGQKCGGFSLYLHIEICKRTHGEAPTRTRCIADHINGNSLDNRRHNLDWRTKRENNRNRFGQRYYQGALL